MGPEAALTIGIFAFVIVGIHVLRLMPKGKVAQVDAAPRLLDGRLRRMEAV